MSDERYKEKKERYFVLLPQSCIIYMKKITVALRLRYYITRRMPCFTLFRFCPFRRVGPLGLLSLTLSRSVVISCSHAC